MEYTKDALKRACAVSITARIPLNQMSKFFEASLTKLKLFGRRPEEEYSVIYRAHLTTLDMVDLRGSLKLQTSFKLNCHPRRPHLCHV